jgi:hypothetical protein
MSRSHHLCRYLLAIALITVSGSKAYGQLAETYRQAAAAHRAAGGACNNAWADYYDSIANDLQGRGQQLPQPTCTPGSGGSGGASGGGANRGASGGSGGSGGLGGTLQGLGGSTIGLPTSDESQQAQDLMNQGIGIVKQIFEMRRQRKEEEQRLKELQEKRDNDRREQEAVEAQRREAEALQERIAEEKQREQALNDSACQLLIESRALLGQAVDLSGPNACGRLIDNTLEQMAKPTDGKGGGTTRTPGKEPVIDGSKIPNQIDFPVKSKMNKLLESTTPSSGTSASDRLLESLGPDSSSETDPVVSKLNSLLDAAVVKR